MPKEVRGIKKEYQHNFCLASEGIEKNKPVTLCTLLAATSPTERDMWVASIVEAIKSVATTAPTTAPSQPAPTSTSTSKSKSKADPTPRGAKVGGDVGAGSIQAGQSVNLEQMKMMDPEQLITLRIKQLKSVLDYMGLSYADALEKKDLVSKIVKYR